MFKITNNSVSEIKNLVKQKITQKVKPEENSTEKLQNSEESKQLVSSKDVIKFLEQNTNDKIGQPIKTNLCDNQNLSNYSRLYTIDVLREYGLNDEEIEKYFNHNTETRYRLEDNSPVEADDYSLKSKTINDHEYRTDEDAIKAIINLRNGFIDMTSWTKEEVIAYTYKNLDRTEYKKQDLIDMGFKWDANISKYFESTTLDISNADKIAFRLKYGLRADGKPINTVYELLDAINNEKKITNDTELMLERLRNGSLNFANYSKRV